MIEGMSYRKLVDATPSSSKRCLGFGMKELDLISSFNFLARKCYKFSICILWRSSITTNRTNYGCSEAIDRDV